MIIDLYAGPRGWSEGMRALGLVDVGIEVDAAACATAHAAGHATIRADVAAYPLGHLVGRVDGLIASPPCQAFSAAGKGEGRDAIPELAAAIHRGDWAWHHDDDRVRHVLEVGRWAEAAAPTWIVCEQVPPVLPLWRAYAARWRHLYGWSCWAGVLNAADYGVPQTRQRAFLIVSTDGSPITPPTPTHCQGGALTLHGELHPWVTMADALGWADTEQAKGPGVLRPFEHESTGAWWQHRPATTLAGDARVFPPGGHTANDGRDNSRMVGRSENTVRLTISDALILQGFPPDYPVQGTRTKQFEQVGNAVPPPLAAAVVGAATGLAAQEAAA